VGLRRRFRHELDAGTQRLAVARIRVAAWRADVDLDLQVAPTARLGRIDVRFVQGRAARLHIGEHSVIDDGVELRFRGGGLQIGDWCELRRGSCAMVGGRLTLEGQNLLSWGVVIHCDEAVTIGRRSSLSEHATVTDSIHDHAEGEWHLDRVRTDPVVVGTDTWVGAKATITQGVTVGDHCVVAAGAVVTHDVPDRHAALGVPASARPLGAAD
jgi:acetyltransferase-like isoleucine patch superfamily enzyme